MSDQVGISEAHDAGKVLSRVAMMVWRDLEALTTGEPIDDGAAVRLRGAAKFVGHVGYDKPADVLRRAADEIEGQTKGPQDG